MRSQSLQFKVGLYLTIALSAAMLLFTGLVAWQQREELLDQVADHVTQLSEVITKSTRFAMLQNQPTYVDRIIHDVASQEGIDKVRILSKDGKIIHSTFPPEIGQTRRPQGRGLRPLSPERDAARAAAQEQAHLDLHAARRRRRLLGSMEVIRNEPSCYTAACHQHSQGHVGARRARHRLLARRHRPHHAHERDHHRRLLARLRHHRLAVRSACSCTAWSTLPLRDLETGARRLSSGNLEQPIPVRSDDEFGQLARLVQRHDDGAAQLAARSCANGAARSSRRSRSAPRSCASPRPRRCAAKSSPRSACSPPASPTSSTTR